MLTRVARLKLPPDARKYSLQEYLARRFTYLSYEQWGQAIQEGRITLDGIVARGPEPLVWNSILEYFPPERPEPPVCRQAELIAEEKEFFLINKPANLPCHPAGAFFVNTLWALLKEGGVPGLPATDDIHFVSRLDRETSGIVWIARTPPVHHSLMQKLQKAPYFAEKHYLVVVHGKFPQGKWIEARGWLHHDEKSRITKKRAFTSDNSPAPSSPLSCPSSPQEFSHTSLYGRGIWSHNGTPLSLVEAVLHTGRLHQIRATMCSLGYPVLGDKLYGLDENIYLRYAGWSDLSLRDKRNIGLGFSHLPQEDQQKLLIPRQALHAWKLRLGEKWYTAPFPAEELLVPKNITPTP